MKILIDNGHGQSTPGKRSPDGRFLEFLFNRTIAKQIEKMWNSFSPERVNRPSLTCMWIWTDQLRRWQIRQPAALPVNLIKLLQHWGYFFIISLCINMSHN